MWDSLGGTTTYAYDFEDRLTDPTAPWGTVYSFGYDGEWRRTSLTSTSGRNTSYGYTNGLLTALSHTQSGVALTDLVYDYDVDGQLTGITDNLDPTKSLGIHYDDLNRLVQVDQGVQGDVGLSIADYAYDGEGNRLVGYVSDTTTASYAYDAMDRRIAKVVDGVMEAFVYDPWSYRTTANDVVLDFEDSALARCWLHGNKVDEPFGLEVYAGAATGGSGSALSDVSAYGSK